MCVAIMLLTALFATPDTFANLTWNEYGSWQDEAYECPAHDSGMNTFILRKVLKGGTRLF